MLHTHTHAACTMLHADDARTMLHMLPMQCCMGTRHTCTDNTRGQQEGYDLSPVRDLPEGLYQVVAVTAGITQGDGRTSWHRRRS